MSTISTIHKIQITKIQTIYKLLQIKKNYQDTNYIQIITNQEKLPTYQHE